MKGAKEAKFAGRSPRNRMVISLDNDDSTISKKRVIGTPSMVFELNVVFDKAIPEKEIRRFIDSFKVLKK